LTSTPIRTALGHQFAQQPKPLGFDLLGEKVGAGRVAARPGEVGDQTELHRVFADAEDDRDDRGRSFGCLGCEVAASGDNGDATTNEVVHNRWHGIEPAIQPMVLDRHVLALDEAGLVETLTEGIAKARNRRRWEDEADHRQCPTAGPALRAAMPPRRRGA
jgi:hypothetical protein